MFAFFLACDPIVSTVAMTGIVQDAPANEGAPVSESALITLDRDGATVGEATTDADGAFAIDVPAGASFFLEVSGEGYVSTAFSAYAGMTDFEASTGYPWLATTEWVEAERLRWEGCPTASEGATLVTGQALAIVPGVDDFSSWPALPGASLLAYDNDLVEYPACYLDDDGKALADGTETGATGEYAVFGLPPGAMLLELSVVRQNGELGSDVYEFVAPEEGLVPVYPTPVEL